MRWRGAARCAKGIHHGLQQCCLSGLPSLSSFVFGLSAPEHCSSGGRYRQSVCLLIPPPTFARAPHLLSLSAGPHQLAARSLLSGPQAAGAAPAAGGHAVQPRTSGPVMDTARGDGGAGAAALINLGRSSFLYYIWR